MHTPKMDVDEALSRISEIHEQIAKGEMYRGFRPVPVAASGLIGFAAALLQPMLVSDGSASHFVRYWLALAIIAALVGGSEIAFNYLVREDAFARRRTRQVIGQFIPCLFAGFALSLALYGQDAHIIALLPGLWAICFSLGVFSARPYLPRATGWVALFYLLAGAWLLFSAHDAAHAFASWRIGGVFGLGQLASAGVLYWNIERKNVA